jgi:uncharacterized membrane protein SirB2
MGFLPFLLVLHISCAFSSILLFLVRGVPNLVFDRPLRGRFFRIAPHVVDTLLLATGITLAWSLSIDPLRASWLGVKLLLVVVYIVLGILAFRLQGPRPWRLVLFVLAFLVFADIVAIAVTRSPLGLGGR